LPGTLFGIISPASLSLIKHAAFSLSFSRATFTSLSSLGYIEDSSIEGLTSLQRALIIHMAAASMKLALHPRAASNPFFSPLPMRQPLAKRRFAQSMTRLPPFTPEKLKGAALTNPAIDLPFFKKSQLLGSRGSKILFRAVAWLGMPAPAAALWCNWGFFFNGKTGFLSPGLRLK
jgi:hypothetical protein